MKKTEVKIDSIHDQKVRIKVLREISKHSGVDDISVDKEKRIVTIVGDVDPVKLITKIRKITGCAELVTVGPPKKPEEKKPDDKIPCWYCRQLPCCCPTILPLPPQYIQPYGVCAYDSPAQCIIV